jgi:hypothetical protein
LTFDFDYYIFAEILNPMKIFFGLLSAIFCFLSLSFICPPSGTPTPRPDMVALTSLADVALADSATSSAISLETDLQNTEIAVNRELSEQELKELEQIIPIKIMTATEDIPTTATEIVKYLISMIGGLLTSIILYFLHKRWPDIFTSSKLRSYKNDNDKKTY